MASFRFLVLDYYDKSKLFEDRYETLLSSVPSKSQLMVSCSPLLFSFLVTLLFYSNFLFFIYIFLYIAYSSWPNEMCRF